MKNETTETKVAIFTDRREALIASVGDKRSFFETEVAGNPNSTYYALANTEHQLNVELGRKLFASKKLTKQELHALMADELAGKEHDDDR